MLNLLYQHSKKTLDMDKSKSLLDLFRLYEPTGYPRLIQVGGPLGPFYRGQDIYKDLASLEAYMYEDSILFMDEFCPLDYMRFMCRYLMRNLNLVTDTSLKVYHIIQSLTEGQAGPTDLQYLGLLLNQESKSLGEALVYKNIKQLMAWYPKDLEDHLAGHCHHHICRPLFKAQCINACPAHIHIPGFVALMKEERYQEAYHLMRQDNPLNSICGFVCARPCEKACRRGEITGTVGVRALQRFISSQALKEDYQETCLPDRDQTIGIIGGGPSGLTAAYYLRRTGYQVTIYEKEDRLGGVLAYGVPAYRLPLAAIDQEIETITRLGVTLKTNYTMDKDKFKDLRDHHHGLVLATGRGLGKSLSLDHDHVVTAIDFLKAVRQSKVSQLAENVLVVGGGDVAMDVARTCRRYGSQVTLLALEAYDQMPASQEEKVQAQEEGVVLKPGYAIESITGQTINLKACKQVFDANHHFQPSFQASDQVIEGVGMIVLAIGQLADRSYLPDDYESHDLVVECGDMVQATIIIDAIAQGKAAALKIHQALGGQDLYTGPDLDIPEPLLNIQSFDYDLREIKTLNQKERLHSFDLVNMNYTREDALFEAKRCMRCDQNSQASLLLGRNNQ